MALHRLDSALAPCKAAVRVRLVSVFLVGAVGAFVASCGSGGGGGGGGARSPNPASEIPTDLDPDVVASESGGLLLDLEEISPAQDVSAVRGAKVPFTLRPGPELRSDELAIGWALDERPVQGQGAHLTLETRGLSPGVHTVKAILSEGTESTRVAWRLHLSEPGASGNHPPSILQALPPGGRTVLRGEEVALSVLAADVDALDELHYSWAIDGKRETTEGPAAIVDTRSLSPGPHRVTVTVSDRAGHAADSSASFSWDLRIEDGDLHLPPYFTGAWPAGSPRIGPGGRLRLEVEAVAPNAEDLLRYRWEVDGRVQDATGSVFHFEPREADGELEGSEPATHRITCRLVTGHEEAGEISEAVGWTVERGNVEPRAAAESASAESSAPLVSTAQPGTISLEPGDAHTFRVDALDPDLDLLTYTWYVNGVAQAADGPAFTRAVSAFSGGAADRVEVVVNDGRSSTRAQLPRLGWDLQVSTATFLPLTLASGAIVMDNSTAGTSFTGDWPRSSASGAYGADSLYSKNVGSTYVYTFPVSRAGKYDVLLWWTAYSSRASSVAVTIQHGQGTTTLNVDQTKNGSKWNLLGSFDFAASGKVTIRSPGGTLSTCADAACLSPSGTTSTPTDPAPTAGELILDDGSSGTSSTGTWSPSSAGGYYGSRSLYAKTTGAYTWSRSITAGSYDVYAWWTEWPSRSSAAPYTITHSSGTSKVAVDQRTSGGKWNLLGRYSLGSTFKVTLGVTSDATFSADAIRIAPAGSSPPPPDEGTLDAVVLDAGQSGTTGDGSWSSSSAPNPYGGGSLYARDRGAYVYDLKLPAAGTYGVYAWWTEWSSRSSAVPYEVLHTGGTAVVKVDQRTNGGKWNPLGTYNFGTTARVTIRVTDASTFCADAIRFVAGGGSPAPTDPEPPPNVTTSGKLSELAAFALTSDLARVSWKSSFLGSSTVTFGTSSTASGNVRTVTGSRWDHSVLLEPLAPNTTYYLRVKTESSSTSATSDVFSFRTPDPSPSYTVTSSHPRVFMTQADIPTLRSRIKEEPYATWWSKLLVFANLQLPKSATEIRNDYPRTVMALAFAGLIGDVASYRTKAIEAAMSVAGLSSTSDNKELRERIDFILPVYDWLYAYLSSTQRSTLKSRLAQYAAALEAQVQESEYADGHSNGNQNGAFLAALAVHGEDASAAGIVARALVRYNEGFWPFWREHGSENGGSFKSGWYTTVATQFNYEVFSAWKSATGKNLFLQERAWFERLSDWYLHALRGDMSWDRHGDVVLQLGVDEIERHLLHLIAKEYKNTDAQWLAQKLLDFLPVYGPDMVLDLLWYDSSVPARTPTQSPSRWFKGSGMVLVRDAWKDDAVKAAFRAVPYYMGGHSHLDQCSFSIFYREGLALDSGIYDDFSSSHHRNYYTRTIAHNAILVKDPSEVFKLYGDTYAADGGQYWLDPLRVPHPFPENIRDLTHDDAFNLGGVTSYEDSSLYTYALGDGTLAYNPNKIAAYYRHFLWIKALSGWSQPVILVFDELEVTQSSFEKVYLLHMTNKPSISGSLVTTTSGSGRLYQRTVFPASFSIGLEGGSGREYYFGGRNYAPNRSPKPVEEPGAWRVEVRPTTSRLHEELLHVLYPTTSTTGAPPSVRAIDAATMKGLETQGIVVFFAVKLANVPSVSYTLAGGRRNLLFGLSPLRSHDIYVEGTKIGAFTSSAAGVLDFSTSAAGKVEVIRR